MITNKRNNRVVARFVIHKSQPSGIRRVWPKPNLGSGSLSPQPSRRAARPHPDDGRHSRRLPHEPRLGKVPRSGGGGGLPAEQTARLSEGHVRLLRRPRRPRAGDGLLGARLEHRGDVHHIYLSLSLYIYIYICICIYVHI